MEYLKKFKIFNLGLEFWTSLYIHKVNHLGQQSKDTTSQSTILKKEQRMLWPATIFGKSTSHS